MTPEHADNTPFDAVARGDSSPERSGERRSARVSWAVEVGTEDSTVEGWTWNVRLHPALGPAPDAGRGDGLGSRDIEIMMSWVDHDHLCHGRLPPSEVALRLMRHVVAHIDPERLPSRFDISRLPRMLSKLGGVDEETADLGRLFQRER